jgi:arsenate reductase-like glutaredoxin family protein
MAAFPKLMERPIVYSDTKAFVWRPPEEILKIFRK